MYDYELNENEEVILVSEESLLKKDKRATNVTTIITNQRFLIFELPTDLEGFRFGRVIKQPIKKEVIFETSIESIVEIKKEKEYVKYVLDNANYFYINDNRVYNYMSKMIKPFPKCNR